MTKTRIEEAELIAVEQLADKIEPKFKEPSGFGDFHDNAQYYLAQTLRALVAMVRESR